MGILLVDTLNDRWVHRIFNQPPFLDAVPNQACFTGPDTVKGPGVNLGIHSDPIHGQILVS